MLPLAETFDIPMQAYSMFVGANIPPAEIYGFSRCRFDGPVAWVIFFGRALYYSMGMVRKP